MVTVKDDKIDELREYMKAVRLKDHPESHLIAILHKAQGLYGYLSEDVMDEVAHVMNIPTAHIWGVATFYHFFKLSPRGQHIISICLGTACYVRGAEEVLNATREELKINFGQTTEDGVFTLEETRCLGACGLAPVMMIDDKIYGELTPKKAVEILRTYRKKS